MSDENHQIDRDDCYICSRGNPDILEQHHIVPKRFGGSDTDANLVELCPSCHQAIESLYDERFWTAVGAVSEQRQLDFIAADLVGRLEDLEFEISETLRKAQKELEEDYVGEEVDVAKAEAREKYMESVEPDFTDSGSDTRDDMDKVASFIADTSVENYAPTRDEIVDILSEGDLSEDEILQAIEALIKVGQAYETDDGSIRVISE